MYHYLASTLHEWDHRLTASIGLVAVAVAGPGGALDVAGRTLGAVALCVGIYCSIAKERRERRAERNRATTRGPADDRDFPLGDDLRPAPGPRPRRPGRPDGGLTRWPRTARARRPAQRGRAQGQGREVRRPGRRGGGADRRPPPRAGQRRFRPGQRRPRASRKARTTTARSTASRPTSRRSCSCSERIGGKVTQPVELGNSDDGPLKIQVVYDDAEPPDYSSRTTMPDLKLVMPRPHREQASDPPRDAAI